MGGSGCVGAGWSAACQSGTWCTSRHVPLADPQRVRTTRDTTARMLARLGRTAEVRTAPHAHDWVGANGTGAALAEALLGRPSPQHRHLPRQHPISRKADQHPLHTSLPLARTRIRAAHGFAQPSAWSSVHTTGNDATALCPRGQSGCCLGSNAHRRPTETRAGTWPISTHASWTVPKGPFAAGGAVAQDKRGHDTLFFVQVCVFQTRAEKTNLASRLGGLHL